MPIPQSLEDTLEGRDAYQKLIRLFGPTLLFIGPSFTGESCVTTDFLREMREADNCKIVAHHGESHIDRGQSRFVDLVPLLDMLYTCSPTFIRAAQEQTGHDNIRLLLAAADPALFYPVDVRRQIDLLFIGHRGGRQTDRNEVIYKLNEEFEDIWVAGNWWDKERLNHWRQGIYTHDFSQWCSRAKIALCLVHEAHRTEMYFPSRLVNTMATGAFALATYTPRLEQVFTRKVHLDWYNTYDELVELIHYWLQHDEEREQVARQGYEYVMNNHTATHRARQVLEDVGLLARVV